VEHHAQGGSPGGADVIQCGGRVGGDGLRVQEVLLCQRWAGGPQIFPAVMKEGGYPRSIHPEVELEIKLQGGLIPRGILRAAGPPKDMARLAVLLEGIQSGRVLESTQGSSWLWAGKGCA
jgi:hypothetical protein